MMICSLVRSVFFFVFFLFFFNVTATTEIYTLSLHDALPIYNNELLIPLRLKRGENILNLRYTWN